MKDSLIVPSAFVLRAFVLGGALMLGAFGLGAAGCGTSAAGHDGGAAGASAQGGGGTSGGGTAGATSPGTAGATSDGGTSGGAAGVSGAAGSGTAGTSSPSDGGTDVAIKPLGDGSVPDGPAGTGARFVVVGQGARRIWSDDGKTWTESPLVTNPPWAKGATLMPVDGDNEWLLRGVCYGNGLFVALGGNGKDGLLLTSVDGKTWDVGPTSMPNDGCAYGNGVFATERRFSTDGKTWQPSLKPPKGNRVMKFYNGKFVAVGDGAGNVSYSTDGKSWTELPITYVGVAGEDKGYRDLTVGNGHFYAMKSGNRKDYQFFEWDGVSDHSFTETPLASIVGTDFPDGIVYGGGHLILEGAGFFYDRADGSTTWTRHTLPAIKDINSKLNYRALDIAAYWGGMFSSITGWTTDLVTFTSAAPLKDNRWTGASQPAFIRIVARP